MAQPPPPTVDVCGLGCRFPESGSLGEFWDNLVAGRDLVTEDGRRWPPGALGTPRRFGKVRSWWAIARVGPGTTS